MNRRDRVRVVWSAVWVAAWAYLIANQADNPYFDNQAAVAMALGPVALYWAWRWIKAAKE